MRTQAGGFSSHHISTDWLVNLATGWTLEWGNRPWRHCENRPSSHSFSPGRNSAASSGAVGVAYLLGVLVKVTENTRQQLDLHFIPFFILFLWDLCPSHTYQSPQRVTPCTGKERSGRVTSTGRRKWPRSLQPVSWEHTHVSTLFLRVPGSSPCSLLQLSHLVFFRA